VGLLYVQPRSGKDPSRQSPLPVPCACRLRFLRPRASGVLCLQRAVGVACVCVFMYTAVICSCLPTLLDMAVGGATGLRDADGRCALVYYVHETMVGTYCMARKREMRRGPSSLRRSCTQSVVSTVVCTISIQ